MTTYTANNPVPMSALPTTSGVKQQFLVAATNDGPSTYAPDGLAAAPIFGLGGQQLQGNEIVEEGIATLVSFVGPLLNSGALCWVLLSCDGGAQQVGTATQTQQAATYEQALIASAGAFRLSFASPNLVLKPYRGTQVLLPGIGVVTLPASLTLAPSGLTASTLYFIYLTVADGTPTLVASTTTHTTDPTGVEVMSGDNTKLLVGMEFATSPTAWAGLCRSWRNDLGYASVVPLTVSTGTASETYVEISATLRVPFLIWAGESIRAGMSGSTFSTNANVSSISAMALDGAVVDGYSVNTPTIAGGANSLPAAVSTLISGVTEGFHFVTLFGASGNGAFSVEWVGSGNIGFRTTTNVSIAPHA
ncbi:hypothetical protein [Paraburkholderia solisilvae]|uniref:Uncharacterized protein n=1 Tax=Paraburkholderia solisilvae TaxID=624376 RepID=A0A6J5EI97_9BURK|nr:hypothetical protein [Paraburkholderia solisilvae]CAB3766290.1 hypothetical protein LMG29739_04785 [Paraburkholderia solisilvae]